VAIRFYSREEAQEDAKKRLIEETGTKGSFANVNARRWTLGSVFVNFEPFCGNVNRVERPESSVCCEEVGKGAKNKTGQDT
jgi:hypothetical protein